jgi:hypothetical protein
MAWSECDGILDESANLHASAAVAPRFLYFVHFSFSENSVLAAPLIDWSIPVRC